MPGINLKPDLLTFNNGTAVTPANWTDRRSELHEPIITHEDGCMPATGETTVAHLRCNYLPMGWGGVD
jgi:hypothetical protein